MEVFASVAIIWHPIEPELVLAVTRRNKPNDWGLPGGKIDPGETAEEALIRETFEETGVHCLAFEKVYERVDVTVDKVIYFYSVPQWMGEPVAQEAGIAVAWRPWRDMLNESNTFAPYYGGLFAHLGRE